MTRRIRRRHGDLTASTLVRARPDQLAAYRAAAEAAGLQLSEWIRARLDDAAGYTPPRESS